MNFDFKNIHIGSLILEQVQISKISQKRICNFLNCTALDVQNMYSQPAISADLLLRWSKLLEYDFFRIYSQHLLLYEPEIATLEVKHKKSSTLPVFRKKMYTEEAINFLLNLIHTKKKSVREVIQEYHIPKTTLYKWLSKKRSE